MAERGEHVEHPLDEGGLEGGEHAVRFDDVEIGLDRLELAGARLRPGGVIELARITQLIPFLHLDGGAGGIEQVVLEIPGRPVVEIGRLLKAKGGFLIAARRLVAPDQAGDVGEGVAERLNFYSLDVDTHLILPVVFRRGFGKWGRRHRDAAPDKARKRLRNPRGAG